MPATRLRRPHPFIEALALYALLLVLPTVVLGALHWQQIVLDHRTRMADVPGRAEDASRRLFDLIEQRLRELLESEAQRPYFVYAPVFASPERLGDDLSLQLSPLAQAAT